MATRSEPERLSDAESADLSDRVARFRAGWKADDQAGVARYLPPAGAKHRTAVLVAVAIADMELRAPLGLTCRVETYTGRFTPDLTRDNPPVALLVAEYRLRHQYLDKPALVEYRDRFPARFDELSAEIGTSPRPALPDFLEEVPTEISPALPPVNPSAKTRASISPTEFPAAAGTGGMGRSTMRDSKGGAPRGGRLGDLVVTHGNLDATPPRKSGTSGTGTGKSTILPGDAPYELVRKLGEGAFGEVFEALAPGGIRVAVKRISRNVDHPASLAEHEALEVVKNLSHPFLLKTQAYWVFDDRLIIVMELADGSLADKVTEAQAQGRLGVPPEQLIPLFEQSAKALDYLHSQNISHRDIKPENILILKDHAKVGDFGLARTQQHAMTMVGQTVGTPAYMAPEMWQQKVSLHSDQYSLAATYVRCRLGRNLFDTTVLIEMASFHIHETPDLAPLSVAEQDVLHKALAKNPDDRFASCEEFAAALRAAVLSPSIAGGGSRIHNVRQGGTAIREALQVEEPPPASPRRGLIAGAVSTAAIAITCALAVVIFGKVFDGNKKSETPPNSDPNEKTENKQTVTPEKKIVGLPFWKPLNPAAEPLQFNDKYYHRKLVRDVGGRDVVAVILLPESKNDPDYPFYMLENKVTNHVFAHMWQDVEEKRLVDVTRLKTNHTGLIVGAWRKGALDREKGEPLGSTGEQADVPVVGVTLPEALLVAQELGGQLPTSLEWMKAAGVIRATDLKTGPAGLPLVVPSEIASDPQKALAFKRKALADRDLALGLKGGPWNVDRKTTDVSYYGIRQTVSNGAEWLGEAPNKQPIRNLFNISGRKEAFVFGHSWRESEIATFAILNTPQVYQWGDVEAELTFRAVLIPPK